MLLYLIPLGLLCPQPHNPTASILTSLGTHYVTCLILVVEKYLIAEALEKSFASRAQKWRDTVDGLQKARGILTNTVKSWPSAPDIKPLRNESQKKKLLFFFFVWKGQGAIICWHALIKRRLAGTYSRMPRLICNVNWDLSFPKYLLRSYPKGGLHLFSCFLANKETQSSGLRFPSRAAQCTGTFCDGGKTLYLHHPGW